MRVIRTYSFVVAFMAFVFLLLALPEVGFSGIAPLPPSCCQLEGDCVDSTEGPFVCKEDDFVENAFCNQETGQCELIPVTSSIPTLSEWGLVAAAVILGVAGFIAVRRRKAAV